VGRLQALQQEVPQHEVISHTAHEYVIGAVQTNTIEGFWSIFKRGVVGTFHQVSKKYMPPTLPSFSSVTATGITPIFLVRP
jgi:hypothetical protein